MNRNDETVSAMTLCAGGVLLLVAMILAPLPRNDGASSAFLVLGVSTVVLSVLGETFRWCSPAIFRTALLMLVTAILFGVTGWADGWPFWLAGVLLSGFWLGRV